MGRKPAERDDKAMELRKSLGFETNVPCGCCGSASRRVRQAWRVCLKGHHFVRKSDQT